MQVGQTIRYCPSCGSENFGGNQPPKPLQPYNPAIPPVAPAFPPQTTPVFNPSSQVVLSKHHAWRRYFARTFDGIIYLILAGFTIGYAFPEQMTYLNSLKVDKLLNIVLYMSFMPLEAFCLYAFGTTLGKALYGIKVEKIGSIISFGSGFHRAFNIWVFGLGVGIPLIALFTMTSAYSKLKNTGATSWDTELGWKISHSRLTPFRWICIVTSWLALLFILGALETISTR